MWMKLYMKENFIKIKNKDRGKNHEMMELYILDSILLEKSKMKTEHIIIHNKICRVEIKKYKPERQIRISVFALFSKIKQTQRYKPEIQIRILIFTFQVI